MGHRVLQKKQGSDLPVRHLHVRITKVPDPGPHLFRTEARAIALRKEE